MDVHAHFYPPESEEQRQARLDAMHRGCWLTTEPPRWDPESTLAYMDRTGIGMQMLSNIPKTLAALKSSNEYGALLVREYPGRFGLLAALPTDNPDAALAEIERGYGELQADGFAVTCRYNEVYLGDPKLNRMWEELDRRRAVVFAHPDAYAPGVMGRPAALMEVAFETARTFADMLYAGTFRRYPNVRLVVAHCGGALPALSGRLMLLGNENWVPNPNGTTHTEMRQYLRRLYLDTAATMPANLPAALTMTTADHIVYGSDCGVPCTTDATMDANLLAMLASPGLTEEEKRAIGRNALRLFPAAAQRMASWPG